MTDTLPASPKPDAPIDLTTNLALLEATLGDGYSQRGKAGLNNAAGTLPINYTNIKGTDKTILINFCKAHSAGEAWYWQLPDEGTPRKWYIKNYKETYVSYDVYNVMINVQEVFDI